MAQQDQTEYVRVEFKGGTALVSRQDFERGNWVAVENPADHAAVPSVFTDVDYVKVHFKGGWALAARAEVEAGLWTRIEDPLPTPKLIVVTSEGPPVADVTGASEDAEEEDGEIDVDGVSDPALHAYDPSPVAMPVRRKRGRPPKVRV